MLGELLRLEECPDLEGIETLFSISETTILAMGLEECPDLEGIETSHQES